MGYAMKGTWKENIGGWNNKDTRRKRQTRNHTLNDNGSYLDRKEPKKSVRIEGELEYVQDTITKHGKTKHFYLIKVLKWCYMGEEQYSHRTAYSRGSGYYLTWYDAYTNEKIDYSYKKISIVKELWQEYIHFDEPKVYGLGYRSSGRYGGSNEVVYIYGKPVYDWKRMTFYNDGKRRKYAQKMVNKIDRARTKAYIDKGDWDADVRTHSLSKTIAWEIY